jgi:hypothetical protein
MPVSAHWNDYINLFCYENWLRAVLVTPSCFHLFIYVHISACVLCSYSPSYCQFSFVKAGSETQKRNCLRSVGRKRLFSKLLSGSELQNVSVLTPPFFQCALLLFYFRWVVILNRLWACVWSLTGQVQCMSVWLYFALFALFAFYSFLLPHFVIHC